MPTRATGSYACGHGAYPVVDDDGHVVGIVTGGDVLGDEAEPTQPVLERRQSRRGVGHARRQRDDALNVMIDEQVEHVPVLDDDELVGICTRTDLLKVRQDQREHERRQEGFDFGAMRNLFARRNGARPKAPS